MATRVIKVDDLDGKSDAEPDSIHFSLHDEFYQIDLSEANRTKLEELLAPYISKGRKSEAPRGGRRTPVNGNGNGYGEYDPQEVRTWAARNGIEVADKGRVPETVVMQWRAATSKADESK